MVGNQPTRFVYGEDDSSFWENYPVLEIFMHAADSFVKHIGGTAQIWAANRDWFLEEWGRDTFISFPGILFVTRRFDEAKQIVRDFATYEKNGLIPNRMKKNKIEYNSVDAPLWFIQATKSYWQYTGDLNFVTEMLPILRRIIDAHKNGTSYERFGKEQTIKMNENDALIVSPPQATWMDADPSGTGKTIVTPRNGKAVEINVLWYDNIKFLAKLERQEKNLLKAEDYGSLADDIKKSLNTSPFHLILLQS